MEAFVVLVAISFVYAFAAAYKWRNIDSHIVGFFLAQVCLCYFMAFKAKENDVLSIVLTWNLGTACSCVVGGSIGGIIGGYIKIDEKRSIGHWLRLVLANLVIFLIGLVFLFLSL